MKVNRQETKNKQTKRLKLEDFLLLCGKRQHAKCMEKAGEESAAAVMGK